MDPLLYQTFQQLGLATGLGLLVGLQREHAESKLAGLRTFPLITVLGTVCGLLGAEGGAWIVAVGLIAVVAVIAIGNVAKIHAGQAEPGVTTEAALLLMYAVGAYLTAGPYVVAIAVGGGVAVLLQFKEELHGLVDRLGDPDLRAIMQFVLIACIVLPILPDKAFGPYQVFNPFETWLLVVLIVGISLGGYIAYKFLGRSAGILLGGIFGGAISSTATTVAWSRRVTGAGESSLPAAVVILIATAAVYVRVLIEISVISAEFLRSAAAPVSIMMTLAVAPALVLWWRFRRGQHDLPEQDSPKDLRAAIGFAVLYVGVLFGLSAGKEYLGAQGLYLVAGLSGLTDMDAITLSTSRMVARDRVAAATGWRLIVTAAMSNLVFKAGIVAVLGPRRLLTVVAACFGLSLAGGLALLLLWPE